MTAAIAPHAADDPGSDFEAKLADLLSGAAPVRTPSRAEIDAMFDRHDAGRVVVELAREWRRASSAVGYTRMGDFLIAAERLAAAVDALEALYAPESRPGSESTTEPSSAPHGVHSGAAGQIRGETAPTNGTEGTNDE